MNPDDLLLDAAHAGDVARALTRFGVRPDDLAGAGAGDGPDGADTLGRVRDLVLVLAAVMTPRAVRRWFETPNRLLSGQRPLDRLRAGDLCAVERAGRAADIDRSA